MTDTALAQRIEGLAEQQAVLLENQDKILAMLTEANERLAKFDAMVSMFTDSAGTGTPSPFKGVGGFLKTLGIAG